MRRETALHNSSFPASHAPVFILPSNKSWGHESLGTKLMLQLQFSCLFDSQFAHSRWKCEISVRACPQANLWGPISLGTRPSVCKGLVPRLGPNVVFIVASCHSRWWHVTELSKVSNVFLVTDTPPPSGFIACSLIFHAAKLGVWVAASLSPGNEARMWEARGEARWGLVFWEQAGVHKNGRLEEERVTM